MRSSMVLRQHLDDAENIRIRDLGPRARIHRSTDRSPTLYARACSLGEPAREFPGSFNIDTDGRYVRALSLPLRGLAGERRLNWRLWVRSEAPRTKDTLRGRAQPPEMGLR